MKARRATICPMVLMLVLLVTPRADGRASTAHETTSRGMTLGQAVVLGMVEGITEYLPVSSTGHLLFAQRIMGIGEISSGDGNERQQVKSAADAYAICIQAGAIMAVLGLYARRVKQMFAGLIGRDAEGLRMVINIVSGFLPAAIIGLLFADVIKSYLFGPWPIVVAWFIGGVVILIVSWRRRSIKGAGKNGKALAALTWRMALCIGVAQCLAMWPGVSRSLMTIVGGIMTGLSLPAAVEFSFLLGVVTLGGATCYDGLKFGEIMLQVYDPSSLAIGLIVAFLSAMLAVKWMVAYLNRHGLSLFGYYRVMVGLAAGLLLSLGIL